MEHQHPIYRALSQFKAQYGYDLMTPVPVNGFEADEPLEHGGPGRGQNNNIVGDTNASDT